MSGKIPKQLSKWHMHVKTVRASNPTLSYKEALKMASKSYHKAPTSKERHFILNKGFSRKDEVHKTIKNKKGLEKHKRVKKGRIIPERDRHQTLAGINRLYKAGKITPSMQKALERQGLKFT